MKHPFSVLQPEYSRLLSSMRITKVAAVNATAKRLMKNLDQYRPVTKATGIPEVFIAASFEREASSNFSRSPAQGDPWNRVSTHVPAGRGPFKNWYAAALDAYALNGLDKVGKGKWTWELACYYGEIFNGMGYRNKGLRSPYLWGGSNLQQLGKYVADGKFDSRHYDSQLGIIPMMKAMVALDPSLEIKAPDTALPEVVPTPIGLGGDGPTLHDTAWIQRALNTAGADPQLRVDGNYGKKTRHAVMQFQRMNGLVVDGLAGPKTQGALEKYAQ